MFLCVVKSRPAASDPRVYIFRLGAASMAFFFWFFVFKKRVTMIFFFNSRTILLPFIAFFFCFFCNFSRIYSPDNFKFITK